MAAKQKKKVPGKKPVKKAAPKRAVKKVVAKKSPRKKDPQKYIKLLSDKMQRDHEGVPGSVDMSDVKVIGEASWYVPPADPWCIVHTLVDNMQVFGVANDQRVYRWDTRRALWVLHKDGI